jgi:hypothetical protein
MLKGEEVLSASDYQRLWVAYILIGDSHEATALEKWMGKDFETRDYYLGLVEKDPKLTQGELKKLIELCKFALTCNPHPTAASCFQEAIEAYESRLLPENK